VASTTSACAVLLCLLFVPAPALAVEAPEDGSASNISVNSATLNGVLNPGSAPEKGTYQFLYRRSAHECGGESLAPEPPGAMLGTTKQAVSTPVTGLTPGADYTFCLEAINVAEEPALALTPVTFKTESVAPEASGEHATEVTGNGATLGGEVNPGGAETSYYFEYGKTEAYGESTRVVQLASSEYGEHPAVITIEGLEPGTEYFYRLVAANGIETARGHGKRFKTQSAGGALALPDGRQYEMVSPEYKGSGQVLGITAANGVTIAGSSAEQAAENGSGMTYLTSTPTVTNPSGDARATQVLSTREPDGGWTSQDVSPPHSSAVGAELDLGESDRLFSSDLSRAVVQEPRSGEIVLRENLSAATQLLPTVGESPDSFVAGSADLTHIVVNAEGGLYEWDGGTSLEPVSLLPGGAMDTAGKLGGPKPEYTFENSEFAGRHAVSNDGTRIVWGDGKQLFSRNMLTREEVQVDASRVGAGSGEGVFELASNDGSRVFFEDQNELVRGGAPGLYMFDVEDNQLTDIAPVTDVLGANEEGTSLYVLSESRLSTAPNAQKETAAEGAQNIFLLHESPVGSGTWSKTFVATLSPSDDNGYFHGGAYPQKLVNWSVRTSPNGEYFAFMSDESLTGYDNDDAASGKPDEEVFLYRAPENPTSETGTLVCASCDPTGARPTGEYDTGVYPGLAMDPTRTWGKNGSGTEPHWVASLIPGWNEALGPITPYNPSVYESRVLSNEGRLFFDSSDALVPQDVNGKEDVYEYEPDGVGSCSTGASGCVALISSGQGKDNSDFVDASASGDDVFFVTSDRLVAADKDNAVDMYDAHVCTSAAPCLSPSAAVSPPCDSTDACRAAAVAQPGVFGVPASATFSGAGNLTPPPAKTLAPAKPRVLTRAQKLSRALRACRKVRSRSARSACERAARKKYGPAHATKSKKGTPKKGTHTSTEKSGR
jgi:hypothetical protein